MMVDDESREPQTSNAEMDRRCFLSHSSVAMTAGVVASYGTLAVMAGRFFYPAASTAKLWMFVAKPDSMRAGDSMEFETPTGAKVVIARRKEQGTADDFIALSSTCPHLGCQVDWQPHQDRFFCPCHNGAFTPEGEAIEGPPAAAGQSLPRYPLQIENGLIFIEVPVESLPAPGRETLAGRSPRRQGCRSMLAGLRRPARGSCKEA